MIVEVTAAAGAVTALIAVPWLARQARGVKPPEPRERPCEGLHRVAALEEEVYGQVMSSDAAEHVAKCWRSSRPTPPPRPIRAEDVTALRQLVAECEQIKAQIQERERLERVRADLGVEGYEPDLRLPELRTALVSRLERLNGMTRAWESDPQAGPGATRVC